MQVRQVSYDAVAPFAGVAAKDRVSISNTKNTEWFGIYEDNKMLGFAGLMRVSAGYRIKGVYVHPWMRGCGVGDELTNHLFDICDSRCADIEVYAYNAKFYMQKGFKEFGELPNGAKKLRRAW